MKTIDFGRSTISDQGPCYVIAEIGHNHQGNLKVALDMIGAAADCGVDAVKFQKRDNKALYNRAMYNKPYDNENSFGLTYGEHREFLEFEWDDYVMLKKLAEEKNVELMCTAFDFPVFVPQITGIYTGQGHYRFGIVFVPSHSSTFEAFGQTATKRFRRSGMS